MNFTPPDGYAAQITGVQYWDSTTSTWISSQAACTTNSPQLITITVTDTVTGTSFTITTVVDNPSAPPPPVASAASHLLFVAAPGNGTAGAAFGIQPVVEIATANGQPAVSDLSTVTLTIASGTPNAGGTGTLTGCQGTPVYGYIYFSNCSIAQAGTGYSLMATDSADALPPVTSSPSFLPFNLTSGTASQLAFTTEPGGTSSGGQAFGTQPVVTVEDAFGNPVTNDNSTVNLAIATGTSGATLLNCSESESNGIVSFAGCAIDKVGSYTLTATDGALTPATSAPPLTVSRGPAYQVVFTTSPTASTGGATLNAQPVVAVVDAGGNPVTSGTNSNAKVTLSIGSQPGTGATLTCTTNPVTANAGVANFAGCKVTGAQGSYTLVATGTGGLFSGTSASFTVAGTPATQVAFTQQPGISTSGAVLSVQPKVSIEDSSGDVVTTDISTVTLSVSSGAGTLSGCTSTKALGVVSFANCKVTGTQGAYTLTATDGTLTPATSASFTVAGTPTKLGFIQQPGNSTGGAAFAAQPVVVVEDSSGDVVTNNTSLVSLTIGTNPGGGNLACSSANPLHAVAGVAFFTGCAITTAGQGYTLTATDGTLTPVTSTPFNISTGVPSQLVFSTEPGGGANGVPFAAQPVVSVEDSGGNVVTSSNTPITLSINTLPGSGALLDCDNNAVSAVAGVATFSGCDIIGKIGSYTLSATASGPISGTSTPFGITLGAPAQLVFTAQPANGASGVTFTNQPVVTIDDIGGNTVTTSNAQITLGINSQPAIGATLTCTNNTVAANAGVASFAGCKVIGKAGLYSLNATANGPVTGTSGSFNITGGTPAKLVFTTQPGGGPDGAAFATQPVVTIEDTSGNTVTTSNAQVTLGINSQPATGATLTCTNNAVAANAGVASFANCKVVGKIGSYTLSATMTGPITATSSPFGITVGAASQLVFTTQPVGGVTEGTNFATQPVVTVEDSGSNPVTTDNGTVAVSIGTYAGGNGGNTQGTLGCTATTVNANAGVATFAGCQITGTAGAGTYTLNAARGGLATGTSANMSITAGTATKLAFTTQPGGGVSEGTNFAPMPVVSVQDANDNTVTTDNGTVALSVNTYAAGNGGTTKGTLGCTNNTVSANAGVASFAGCKITGTVGAGTYTLSATRTGLATANSSNVTITAGPAAKLVFTTQPGGGPDGAAFATQPVVTIEDTSGNTVTTSNAQVTLGINSQPATGATLTCTNNAVAANAGVASFANCKVVGKIGSYTLSATMTGPITATSSPFGITVGAASQLVFTTQPVGGVTEGTNFATQPVVTVEDSGSNPVTTDNGTVAVSIGTYAGGNGGNTQGTLGCTATTVNANAGVATFAGCQITGTAGAGTYTLNAARGGLATGTSANMSITAGTATKLAFTTQPGGGVSEGTNFAPMPVVSVQDANDNTVTTDNGTVALSVNTYAAGNGGTTKGTLGCTNNTVSANAGVASFAGCKITGTVGAGTYTLSATRTGLATANSSNVTITAGPAAKLVFTTQPGGGPDGAAFATQPVVTIEDTSGNTVTTSNAQVTLGINSQPATGATLTCTNNAVAANAGVASFANCKVVGKIGSYTLSATMTGPITATSSPFGITVGAASQLVFTTQPVGGVTEGTNFATQPVVTVEDSGSNPVTTDNGTVAVSIGTYAGGNGGNTQGTLGCTATTVNANAGVATFAGCQITGTAGAGTYTLNAARGGLATGTSANMSITAGTATKLAFTTQPGGGVSEGTNFAPMPVVSVQDANDNTVTTDNGTVALSVNTYAAGNGGTTKGTLGCTNNTVSANAGVASFAGCKITGTVGAGTYTLSATRTGLATANSSNVTITAGPAAKLVFTSNPASVTASSTTNVTLGLQIQDQSGNNTVSTGTTTLTLSTSSDSGFFAPTLGVTGTLGNTINVSFANGVGTGTTFYGDENAGTPSLSAQAGATAWGTSTPLTVTAGTAVGLGLTNATTSGSTSVTCGAISSNYTCAWTGAGRSGHITANVSFIDQFGNPTIESATTNSTVSLTNPALPNTLTVLKNTTTTTTTFTLTMNQNTQAVTTITSGTFTLKVTVSR